MTQVRNNSDRTWLIVGSSPDAGDHFDVLLPLAGVWMTCNAGWQLFLTHDTYQGIWADRLKGGRLLPDHYWISDPVAAAAARRAIAMMAARGTRIITADRADFVVKSLGLPVEPHERVKLGAPPEQPAYTPGKPIHPTLSGLICLQYALDHGASRVILVGMSGYRSKESEIVTDSFDGRKGKAGGSDQTQYCIRPFIQSAINALPHVQFVVVGKLAYTLTGPNVSVHPNAASAVECLIN